MRNRIAVSLLVVACGFLWTTGTKAQPGNRRQPPRTTGGTVPTRPGASRGAESDPAQETKSPGRPAVKFSSGASAAENTESDETTDDRRPTAGSRPSSRFGNREEPPSEPAQETEEAPANREEYRSASLEDRAKTRGNPSSKRLLEQAQENPSETETTEPAPLANRDGARSVEAQAIRVTLNDSEAGLSLAFALNLDHSGSITGYPIRMEQVLAASPDSGARRAAIRAYWNLVVSIADHHHALDELDRITQIAASANDKLTEAAAAAAEARVAETKVIVTAAQFDLAAFTPSPATLPIPADAPLVSEYRTEYAALFGRGPAPLAIKRLSIMLPLYKDQVLARGRATIAASEAIDKSGDLETFKHLCEHRRAFLTSVRDYNDAIADYALQLTTPGMSAETVTSMLIVRSQPAADARPDLSDRASRGSSEVVQASAAQPIESSVIKPRRIGSVRSEETETAPAGPDEEESDTLKSDPEPSSDTSENSGDLTEAPAKPHNWRFVPKRNEE